MEKQTVFHANGNKKKAGVAILISDKIIDFKIKKDCYKEQRRKLHNDQGINPRRRYKNCKYVCNQHRSISMYKANTNKQP